MKGVLVMFDELEKIWIEDIFIEKIEDKMQEQNNYISKYRVCSEALTNDIEALKSSFEKIKKLF